MILRQYVKMLAQNCVLPVCYKWNRRRKINRNMVIFADAHHESRPESMGLLYQRLAERKFEIVELYLDYQKSSFTRVIRHMMTFMKLYAGAGYVVICDNFLPVASCRKRPETKVIQLWHGCGCMKKFGYDTEDDIPATYKGNVFRNIDLVTVSARRCVAPFASAMRLPESHVQPMGVSRTDAYFQKGWSESCRAEFYRLYPEARGKKIVLWAPTFRGNAANPALIHLDLERLQRELGEEWLVISRVHPHMHKDYVETDCRMTTERLFPVIDVLIADYSSLIYEYLLFDKPLVLFVPDLEDYLHARGFYMEFSEIPGYRVQKAEALPMAVSQEYLAYSQESNYNKVQMDENRMLRRRREQFLDTYMRGCDGHATDRIVEYMMEERGL